MKIMKKIALQILNFFRSRSHRTNLILCISVVTLLIAVIIPTIYINSLLNKVNYTDWSDAVEVGDIFETDTASSQYKEVGPEDVSWYTNLSHTKKDSNIKSDEKENENTEDTQDNIKQIEIKQVDGIYNFLIVGEEAINTNGNGRTDSMLIVTLDTINNAIKITSLMRDTYVQIPGYKDNRLNAAYSMGGMPLLINTIETNYRIKITNSAKVDFTSFESVIDKLGGVEIDITPDEAEYLNSTNYISNKSNRTLVAGRQILNGNQALGYARVRYVKSENGESNDFGRTNRHRTILDAIFNKYKEKSPSELIKSLEDILPLITTDMKKKEIISYAKTMIENMPESLDTLRLPVDKSYTGASIRNMSVLTLDWRENITVLFDFIYGDDITDIEKE